MASKLLTSLEDSNNLFAAKPKFDTMVILAIFECILKARITLNSQTS